jgi:hypothetical protein
MAILANAGVISESYSGWRLARSVVSRLVYQSQCVYSNPCCDDYWYSVFPTCRLAESLLAAMLPLSGVICGENG